MTNKMVPITDDQARAGIEARNAYLEGGSSGDAIGGMKAAYAAIAAAPEPPSVEAGELPDDQRYVEALRQAKYRGFDTLADLILAYDSASRPAPVGVVNMCEYCGDSAARILKAELAQRRAEQALTAALTHAAPVAEKCSDCGYEEHGGVYCSTCNRKIVDFAQSPPVAAGLTDAERAFVDELGVTLQGPGPVIGMTKAMAGSLYSAIRRLAASPVSGGTGNG